MANFFSQARDLVRVNFANALLQFEFDRLAQKFQLTAVRDFKEIQAAQEGALARAARAQDGDDLPSIGDTINSPQDLVARK